MPHFTAECQPATLKHTVWLVFAAAVASNERNVAGCSEGLCCKKKNLKKPFPNDYTHFWIGKKQWFLKH